MASRFNSFMLGATVECVTVKVYDNVYRLRMEPPNGEFGSQDFNDFVVTLGLILMRWSVMT